jgi:hypothetical protein
MMVLILMGFVLTAGYAALQLAFKSAENQRRDGFVTANLSEPLQIMDIVLSQNIAVDSVSNDYLLSVVTDKDADNLLERHVYQATADGRLIETVYSVNNTLANTSTRRTTTWTRVTVNPVSRNVNVLNASPLFSYYSRKANGSRETTAAAKATEIGVNLVVRYDTRDFNDTRLILFRNR